MPKSTHVYHTRTLGNIPTNQCRTDTLKHFFYPWTITTLNKIYLETQNTYLTIFMEHLFKEIHPVSHSVYIYNPNGLKLPTRLRLGLSHLNKRILFNYNFEN